MTEGGTIIRPNFRDKYRKRRLQRVFREVRREIRARRVLESRDEWV